jgi:signal transduction histidine kinase
MIPAVGPRRVTAVAALCGCVVTLAAAAIPHLYISYRLPALRGGSELALALAAGTVAFLVLGRSRQRGSPLGQIVALAFGTFAAANVVFSVAERVAGRGDQLDFSPWHDVSTRLLGAAVLALTAYWLLRSSRATVQHAARAFASVALLALVIGVVTAHNAPAPTTYARPGEAPVLDLSANPFVTIPPIVVAICLALAAVAFAQRAAGDDDELWGWLGAGCALAAAAGVNDLLFPPLMSGFYTSDALRLGAALLWLAGCGREVASYWAGWSQLVVAEERRRIARDLHDGLAQELAFIAAQTELLSQGDKSSPAIEQLEAAARRALAESRRAIRALSTGDELLEVALTHAAEDVAQREGVRLQLALDTGIVVGHAECEALARIVSEAATNAARHGHASTVTVELTNGNGYRLRVSDDGTGFDPVEVTRTTRGFGMVSMRERAAALGADFAVVARPGSGATVEVAWS